MVDPRQQAERAILAHKMQQQGLSTVILQRVLVAYGLTDAVVNEPQKGYRNTSYKLTLSNGELRNLIFYKNEPGMAARISRTNVISHAASDAGLPTRRTLGRIVQLRSPNSTRYACLYSYLPGQTIPWEAYTKDHIKNLGAALGKLHAVCKNAYAELPRITDECRSLSEEMQAYFSSAGVKQAMQQKLSLRLDPSIFAHFEKMVRFASVLPGEQPLHMDFVRGNILFNKYGEVTGILDFEKYALGPRVFDLARTLAFLYVDCKYKRPEQIRKYFLQSGYIKRGGQELDAQTYPLLKALVGFFMVHDFYKFLRHNPYESLSANEHFVRTVDFLVRYTLLKIDDTIFGNSVRG